jgi:hypothetical protein
MDYYRNKYSHGFFHYLKQIRYLDTIEDRLDSTIEYFIEAAKNLLAFFVNLFLLSLEATVTWLPLRIHEYCTCRKQLKELEKKGGLE